jgi:hypothetical protein
MFSMFSIRKGWSFEEMLEGFLFVCGWWQLVGIAA